MYAGRRAVVVTYVPEPIGAANAEQLQRMTDGQLDGGRLGGLPHVFCKGEASVTYTGLVSSPQQFIGQAQMGKTPGVAVLEYPALPNASAPAAVQQWLEDWTNQEELLS